MSDIFNINEHMEPNDRVPLSFNGAIISDRDEKLNLTDMWRAAGSPDSKKPVVWLRTKSVRDFADHLASSPVYGDDYHLIEATAGRGGSTWAHWQVGLAYAKHLSPEFHAWANQVVRERMERRGVPNNLTPAGFVSWLTNAFTGINDRFDQSDRKVWDISQTLFGMSERLCAVEDNTRHTRKDISAAVKKVILQGVAAQYYCRCPMCQETPICDEEGNKLPKAQFDHFLAANQATADSVWAICEDCHDKLTRNPRDRLLVQVDFQVFQHRLRAYQRHNGL
jgi:hypothetical protein